MLFLNFFKSLFFSVFGYVKFNLYSKKKLIFKLLPKKKQHAVFLNIF